VISFDPMCHDVNGSTCCDMSGATCHDLSGSTCHDMSGATCHASLTIVDRVPSGKECRVSGVMSATWHE
jgi:hypothetical protein